MNFNFKIKDKVILKNLNVVILKKQKTLVIGKLGSGKTTLFSILIKK